MGVSGGISQHLLGFGISVEGPWALPSKGDSSTKRWWFGFHVNVQGGPPTPCLNIFDSLLRNQPPLGFLRAPKVGCFSPISYPGKRPQIVLGLI